MTDELKLIKKYYGEETMHFCRDNFATILEEPGKLISILERTFAHDKYLIQCLKYEEDEFKSFIYEQESCKKMELVSSPKNPFELMDEAGYTLYECKCEEDIKRFKKYYAKGEELCTFRGGRLDSCYVFFAVKKNVKEIKRFDKPQREDEYGTSVISIQFSRGSVNIVSIKNRYNHTVTNPDATFSNNLENIIPGLTKSFEKYLNLKVIRNSDFDFDEFVLAKDNRFYRYNCEIDNIYYCPNNIIIDNGIVKSFDKSQFLVFDYFIIDLKKKVSYLYDEFMTDDSFIDFIRAFYKIEIVNDNESGMKKVDIYNYNCHVCLYIDYEYASIRKINCFDIKLIGDNFLFDCQNIEKIVMPEVEYIGNFFIPSSYVQEAYLPKVKSIGSQFLLDGSLEIIDLPEVINIGNDFMYKNNYYKDIELINMPKVEVIGNDFITYRNGNVKKINMPNVKKIGDGFLSSILSIMQVDLSSTLKIGDDFLSSAKNIEKINISKIEEVGANFLESLSKENFDVDFPNLIITKEHFLQNIKSINKINLPLLKQLGYHALCKATNCMEKELLLPNVETVEDFCFASLKDGIEVIDMPKAKYIGFSVFITNKSILKINLPNVISLGEYFLCENEVATEINLESLKSLGRCSFKQNNAAKNINIPKLININDDVFANNHNMQMLLRQIILENTKGKKKIIKLS